MNVAACGILDTGECAFHCRLHGAVLEEQVGVLAECTVLEHEAVDVAQQLFARQAAAHEAEVLPVPAEIFPVDFRIVYCHVFRFPERILRIDYSIAYLDVSGILEAVVAVLAVFVDFDIFAVHESIVAIGYADIPKLDVRAIPKILLAVGEIGILHVNPLHAAEQFGRVDLAVNHAAVARVPQARTCALGK